MGLLKTAFNQIVRIHSAPGFLRRPGSPDIYSPIRAAQSNYFRYLAGPSHTVVTGAEVVIATSSIYGQQKVTTAVDAPPTAGTWTISFALNGTTVTTGSLAFDAIGSDIQAALRLIAGCENVTVVGDLQSSSTQISFIGVKSAANIALDLSSLTGTASATYDYSAIAWPSPEIKRSDKLILANVSYTAVEVIPMYDLGGEVIGYRVRYD